MFSWKGWLIAAAALIVLAASSYQAAPAYAASGSLRVDAGDQPIATGAEFPVRIMQNADVSTLSGQTSLTFDPSILQVVAVDAGPDYASSDATLLIGPADAVAAIDEANVTGALNDIATIILPGGGAPVPAGEAILVTVTMAGIADGTSPLGLAPGCVSHPDQLGADGQPIVCGVGVWSELLDDQGNPFEPSTTGGSVSISGSAPPPPATPSAGGTPGAAPATTGTARKGRRRPVRSGPSRPRSRSPT